MADQSKPDPSGNKNISIIGDVKDSAVFIGDNNTVNQTIIQKFFNIFKSDSETLEHRNRRILLGHVENAWIKGVLDASLHGAALLDLGIKQDPDAVTKYPWAIKRESTDETLPAGTSMLEIFDNIGMGRSLLILGAPGSGKTTMLLELARGLIARAREDITQPIPMVFNLSSWTESKTLADWLAQELNNLYSVPRKTAPDWVKGNKLLLLLDGLDEVRQESRAKCVDAINAFRKEHGLTSLAVCSRSQDYANLNAKLFFEGAIEVQPLTQEQIAEYFARFEEGMTGIKQALEKDSALREMAETPLFLSIMIMAYRNKRDVEILVSRDEQAQRKHLFDTYTERMFERPRTANVTFQKQDVLHWLSWLAYISEKSKGYIFYIKHISPEFFQDSSRFYWLWRLIFGLVIGTITGFWGGLKTGLIACTIAILFDLTIGWIATALILIALIILRPDDQNFEDSGFLGILSMIVLYIFSPITELSVGKNLLSPIEKELTFSPKNFLSVSLFLTLIMSVGLGFKIGIIGGVIGGMLHSIAPIIQHYIVRIYIVKKNLLPFQLTLFLNHCVDLILLRRVGDGYIFIHRLLMEYFADMYTTNKLKQSSRKRRSIRRKNATSQ